MLSPCSHGDRGTKWPLIPTVWLLAVWSCTNCKHIFTPWNGPSLSNVWVCFGFDFILGTFREKEISEKTGECWVPRVLPGSDSVCTWVLVDILAKVFGRNSDGMNTANLQEHSSLTCQSEPLLEPGGLASWVGSRGVGRCHPKLCLVRRYKGRSVYPLTENVPVTLRLSGLRLTLCDTQKSTSKIL